MKKSILLTLILCVSMAGCSNQPAIDTKKPDKTSTEVTNSQTQQTIDLSDEEIIKIIESLTIDIEGSYRTINTRNEEKISADKVDFTAGFYAVEIKDKGYYAQVKSNLVVHFDAFVKSLALASEKKQTFTIALNKDDNYSLVSDPVQTEEIVIMPTVLFDKNFMYDQGLKVHYQVLAKDYDSRPDFYTPEGATVESAPIVGGAYTITFDVNKDTVDDIEILSGDLEKNFFVGSFIKKWINYRLHLKSGAVIKNKNELKYIYQLETKETEYMNGRRIKPDSKPHEYWNFGDGFETNTWGIYTE